MTPTTPSPISDQAAGEHIDIVFDQVAVDGAPPEYSFIEVENSQRASIKFGEWIHRDDGYWVLRISTAPTTGSAPVLRCACGNIAEPRDAHVDALRCKSCWARFASPTQGADARHDRLRKFLDMAAGEGYVFDGVDAADLYLEFFPEGPNGGSRG